MFNLLQYILIIAYFIPITINLLNNISINMLKKILLNTLSFLCLILLTNKINSMHKVKHKGLFTSLTSSIQFKATNSKIKFNIKLIKLEIKRVPQNITIFAETEEGTLKIIIYAPNKDQNNNINEYSIVFYPQDKNKSIVVDRNTTNSTKQLDLITITEFKNKLIIHLKDCKNNKKKRNLS